MTLEIKDWKDIDWKKVTSTVTAYQSSIYTATKSGDEALVNKLQIKLVNSKSAILLAIRRITQVNQGKKTPGIDKLTYLRPDEKIMLYKQITSLPLNEYIPKPVRRIYIPKANKKLRPLGIPTIIDRVQQYRIYLALDPVWDSQFEHSSYGFRPARGCHDAMIRIYKTLNSKVKVWAFDGDIKGCFDNISHEALIERIGSFPYANIIKLWLKAGYFEKDNFNPTELGTPQGGPLSPLLSNIALHGMEKALKVVYHKSGYIRTDMTPIRYADDFVILCKSQTQAEQAKTLISEHLKPMNLEISEEKSRITNANEGFDFLGWTFKNYPSYKNGKKTLTTIVKPSDKSIEKHKEKLKAIWRTAVGNKLHIKIRELNQVITGWALYHRKVNSSKIFRWFDNFNYLQTIRYLKRTHPQKSWKWLVERYFVKVKNDRWVFQDPVTRIKLVKYKSFKIIEHIPIKYGMNPYDPDTMVRKYFEERGTDLISSTYQESINKLAKWQDGKCPVCGENIFTDNQIFNVWHLKLHVHHLIPRRNGGKDEYSNLMLLHEECHKVAHRRKLTKQNLIDNLIMVNPNPTNSFKWDKNGFKLQKEG